MSLALGELSRVWTGDRRERQEVRDRPDLQRVRVLTAGPWSPATAGQGQSQTSLLLQGSGIL